MASASASALRGVKHSAIKEEVSQFQVKTEDIEVKDEPSPSE